MFRAEILKLKRSATWLIALILPLIAVTTGTINLAANTDVLNSGWASFTSQVTLFYGLLFFYRDMRMEEEWLDEQDEDRNVFTMHFYPQEEEDDEDSR